MLCLFWGVYGLNLLGLYLDFFIFAIVSSKHYLMIKSKFIHQTLLLVAPMFALASCQGYTDLELAPETKEQIEPIADLFRVSKEEIIWIGYCCPNRYNLQIEFLQLS